MNLITRRQQLLFHTALLGALAGMILVIAWRSPGQPLPPMPAAVAVSSEPEFVRAWGWYRAADASNYVLTVNNTFIYMMPAKGTNGSTMVVTNVGMESGTNVVTLYASNPSGKSPTVTLRHYISQERTDDFVAWLTSTNYLDVGTSRGTVTNLPASGKFTVKKNQPMRWFWTQPIYGTNWIDERTL
jgi:hypothetical protein